MSDPLASLFFVGGKLALTSQQKEYVFERAQLRLLEDLKVVARLRELQREEFFAVLELVKLTHKLPDSTPVFNVL